MEFDKAITLFDGLKLEMINLQERLRKTEVEKEEMRVRFEYSQRRVTELEFELKARTIVTNNVNYTQSLHKETIDLPLAVHGHNEQESKAADKPSISQEFCRIRQKLLTALSDGASSESHYIYAGLSEHSSDQPDADSGLPWDDINDISFKIPDLPDADSGLLLDYNENSFKISDLPDANSGLIPTLNDISFKTTDQPDADSGILMDNSENSFKISDLPDADSGLIPLDYINDISFKTTDQPDAVSGLMDNNENSFKISDLSDADSGLLMDNNENSFKTTDQPDADSCLLMDYTVNSFKISDLPDADSGLIPLDDINDISFKTSDVPDANSDSYLDKNGISLETSDLPDADYGLLHDDDISIQIKDTDIFIPESSLLGMLTGKQIKNQRTTRRKKEKKKQEVFRKKGISLEESLLPLQNYVTELEDRTSNLNPVMVTKVPSISPNITNESCNQVKSVPNLPLRDDAAQLEDDIDYEIKDFGSVILSSPDESSEIVPAPSLKLEDIIVKPSNQIFPSDYNGMATPFICLESDTEVPDCPLPPETEPDQVSYVQQQSSEEYVDYLHLSNLPYSVSAETIALFLQQEIGPVQSIMYCDENGLLSTGEATVYFSNPGDATKTLLLARHGLVIQGRQVKIKLYVNGMRMHPHHFPGDL